MRFVVHARPGRASPVGDREVTRDAAPAPRPRIERSADESRSINAIRGSRVILDGSGTCTGGRTKPRLRNNVVHDGATSLFVGCQARRTLGRHIVQGERTLRIHGKQYDVNAHTRELHGLSAHAGRASLLGWIERFEEPPKTLFLTHGEEPAALHLKPRIESGFGCRVDLPEYTASVDF